MVKAFRPASRSKHKVSKQRGTAKAVGKSPADQYDRKPQQVIESLQIDTLDHEGVGVARNYSPVAFVSGALPGEVLQVQVNEKKKHFLKGHALEIEQAHPARQQAFCERFGHCGGCQTQYLDHLTMLDMKQDAVTGLLAKFTDPKAFDAANEVWRSALSGAGTGYRRKTRLAVDVRRSNDRRLGYRAQGSTEVVSVDHCAVLQPDLNRLLVPLQSLIEQLQNPSSIGHVELLLGDEASDVTADGAMNTAQPLVVIRTTKTLPAVDKKQLITFAHENACTLALEIRQSEYEVLSGEAAQIDYHLLDGNRLRALPNDFIQVNPEINRHTVAQAIEWLDVQPQDNILDLFCGLGNFSLSLAKIASKVIGLEGVPQMVQHGKYNARSNHIDNVEFYCQDLASSDALKKWRQSGINKVLLDPARAGAKALMPQIMELNPEKILYVSCNPATFGRDIAVLCGNAPSQESATKTYTERELAIKHLAGKTLKPAKPKAGITYKLDKIALLDMFPYTAHTELMALLVRQ